MWQEIDLHSQQQVTLAAPVDNESDGSSFSDVHMPTTSIISLYDPNSVFDQLAKYTDTVVGIYEHLCQEPPTYDQRLRTPEEEAKLKNLEHQESKYLNCISTCETIITNVYMNESMARNHKKWVLLRNMKNSMIGQLYYHMQRIKDVRSCYNYVLYTQAQTILLEICQQKRKANNQSPKVLHWNVNNEQDSHDQEQNSLKEDEISEFDTECVEPEPEPVQYTIGGTDISQQNTNTAILYNYTPNCCYSSSDNGSSSESEDLYLLNNQNHKNDGLDDILYQAKNYDSFIASYYHEEQLIDEESQVKMICSVRCMVAIMLILFICLLLAVMLIVGLVYYLLNH